MRIYEFYINPNINTDSRNLKIHLFETLDLFDNIIFFRLYFSSPTGEVQ